MILDLHIHTHTHTHTTLKDSADEVESLSLRPADPLPLASRLQGARPAALTRPGAVPGGPVVAAHRHPADPEPDVKGANVVEAHPHVSRAGPPGHLPRPALGILIRGRDQLHVITFTVVERLHPGLILSDQGQLV